METNSRHDAIKEIFELQKAIYRSNSLTVVNLTQAALDVALSTTPYSSINCFDLYDNYIDKVANCIRTIKSGSAYDFEIMKFNICTDMDCLSMSFVEGGISDVNYARFN